MDLGRIGLPPRQCECRVVPLDYRPMRIGSLREKLTCRGAGNRSRIISSPSLRNFLDHASLSRHAWLDIAPAFDSLAPRAFARSYIIQLSLSGCRESNPDLTLPKRVYYHYTTPRLRYDSIFYDFL